jgi:hypothetical protein
MSRSKKFRGKPCAYCGDPSIGPDHVIARGFFLPEHRDNLPQVPVCHTCNGKKSALETELMAILPFGARHSSSDRNLQEMVPRRLANNRRLHRQLGERQGRIWTKSDSGLIVQTMTLPVDGEKLLELFKWIARGLIWYHWRVRVTDEEHDVTAMTLTEAGEPIFDRHLRHPSPRRVERDIASGTFWYEGVQAYDAPEATMWRFSLYGGIWFGNPEFPAEVASRIGVMTGPRSIKVMADRAVRFGFRRV